MRGPDDRSSSNNDLTGYWFGEYWYDGGMGSLAQFAAHIADVAGAVEGTTLETVNWGRGLTELTACINGSRDGAAVEFVKRYDAGLRAHRAPIFYAGVANADLTVIEGRWALKQLIFRATGGFRMQRGSQGAKTAVKREAKEPVTIDR